MGWWGEGMYSRQAALMGAGCGIIGCVKGMAVAQKRGVGMRRRRDLMTEAEMAELSGFISDTLGEVFVGRGLVFDAPIMKVRIDQYDEEYLHIIIVYDGDERKYDVDGSLKVKRRVRDKFYDMGFEGVPSISAQLKSEREELLKEGPWWMRMK